jgi:hypothetical protein
VIWKGEILDGWAFNGMILPLENDLHGLSMLGNGFFVS